MVEMCFERNVDGLMAAVCQCLYLYNCVFPQIALYIIRYCHIFLKCPQHKHQLQQITLQNYGVVHKYLDGGTFFVVLALCLSTLYVQRNIWVLYEESSTTYTFSCQYAR